MKTRGERLSPLNRARGLRVGELRRCWRRRHALTGAALRRQRDAEAEPDGYPDCPCSCCDLPSSDPTVRRAELAARVRAHLARPRLLERFPPLLVAPSTAAEPPAAPLRDPRALEDAVAAQLAWIRRLPPPQAACWAARLQEAFREDGLAPAGVALLQGMARARGAALLSLFLFSPLWLRPLRTWRPAPALREAAALESLVRHLLVAYPVPAFLLRAFIDTEGPALRWVAWTALLGQGGSLVRAAPRCGFTVSARVQHHLSEAPALDPVHACQWAAVRALGGGEDELRWLREHPGLALDPTGDAEALEPRWADEPAPPRDDDDDDEDRAADGRCQAARAALWRDTCAWLLRQREALRGLRPADMHLILDWAVHQHTEARRRGGPPFSWRGRGVQATLAAAQAYRRGREVPYAALSWAPRGWDWQEDGAPEAAHRIEELTSGWALYEEGRALRHCVGGYAPACAAGRSAVFSMRRAGERRVTIELDPATGAVRQAHGACNRSLTAAEARVLSAWRGARVLPSLARGP